MRHDNSAFLRAAGFSGLSAAILFAVSAGISIALYSGFSWTGSTLSDLGMSLPSAYIFNGFLVLSGALIFVFARGLSHYLPPGRASFTGPLLIALGSFFLVMVGVFTSEYPVPHFWSAFLFFSLTLSGIVVTGVSQLPASRKRGVVSIALGIFAGLMYALPWPGTGLVLPETASILFAMAFTVLYSSRMIGLKN